MTCKFCGDYITKRVSMNTDVPAVIGFNFLILEFVLMCYIKKNYIYIYIYRNRRAQWLVGVILERQSWGSVLGWNRPANNTGVVGDLPILFSQINSLAKFVWSDKPVQRA